MNTRITRFIVAAYTSIGTMEVSFHRSNDAFHTYQPTPTSMRRMGYRTLGCPVQYANAWESSVTVAYFTKNNPKYSG